MCEGSVFKKKLAPPYIITSCLPPFRKSSLLKLFFMASLSSVISSIKDEDEDRCITKMSAVPIFIHNLTQVDDAYFPIESVNFFPFKFFWFYKRTVWVDWKFKHLRRYVAFLSFRIFQMIKFTCFAHHNKIRKYFSKYYCGKQENCFKILLFKICLWASYRQTQKWRHYSN